MGLRLTGKGSILDAIGNAAGRVGHDITHNPITNFVGHGVVQPVEQAAEATGQALGQIGGIGVEDFRALTAKATANQQAFQSAMQRGANDINTTKQFVQFIPRAGVQLANSAVKTFGQDAIKRDIAKALHQKNPNRYQAPSSHSLDNFTPHGAVQQAILGPQPIPSLQKTFTDTKQNQGTQAAVGNTLLTGAMDVLAVKGGVDSAAKAASKGATAAKEATIPLDESGKIQVPGPSSEDIIHESNPLKPQQPTPTPAPEPTPADLTQAARAAAQIDHTPQPIDFAQVEGAGQRVKGAVTSRAGTLRQLDASAKGDQLRVTEDGGKVRTSDHTPFYRDYYAENGKKPTIAAYQAEAERQLKTGQDSEALNYQHLQRHADAEQELKQYQQADKQSGYNKVRVRNAPAGTPREIPEVVKNKINSPEYAAKRASGEFLQRVRDELPTAKAQVEAIDKQIKKLSKSGDITGIRDLNTQSAAARLRLRYLEGQERAQAGEYGRAARALDEAHPDAILKQKGTRPNATVSGVPVKGGKLRVTSQPSVVDDTPMTPEDYRGFTPATSTPYTGPNLNEGAFSATDKAAFDRKSGIYDSEKGKSYSPDQDLSLNVPEEPAPRDLRGDTAAFETIQQGGSIDDAVKAYQEATGVSEEDAAAAVNRVAETGADMGTNEEVLKRNPAYNTVPDYEPKTLKDVSDKADSYRNVADLQLGHMNALAKGMSEHDIALLDQLRGKPIEEVAQAADKPEQFIQVAQAAKEIADYNHEARRLNGDATIYRQNYGAGMHYAMDTPQELAAVSGYRDTLASTPGFSQARLIGDYDKAAGQFELTRKNANFLEDVANDTRQTINYVRERAIHRGLQDVSGNESVHYGNPTYEQPKQLNGTKDVFASREVAKEWNKLNKPAKDRTILGKSYDAISSLVTQLIVLNPFFHGANQLWQAGEAAGKVPGLGKGATGLTKNLTSMSKEDMFDAAKGIYEHGGSIPDYGKNSNGAIAKFTHGGSNIGRKGMAAIEFRVRTALYKDSVEHGMDPRAAVQNIEKFLGDKHAFEIASRRFTIFLHYFKTLLDVQVTQLKHPIEYKGTIAHKVAMLGALYAVNQAWQQFTGNQDAYIRAPGGAGLIKEEVKSVKEAAKGHYRQAAGIVTNRINPIPKEVTQQVLNSDLFTGQDLSSTGRGSHAINALVSPAQIASRAAQGKKSIGELIENQLQLNTPHTKGQQATDNSLLGFLNTPGAKPGNGVKEQEAYFDSAEQATKGLSADDQKTYKDITGSETDQDGNKIGRNEKQARAYYDGLYAHPRVLDAVVKQKRLYAEKTGTDLDPLYSPEYDDIRQDFVLQQSSPYKGDDYANIGSKHQQELKQLGADRAAYFDKQDFSDAPPSERILPPQFDQQTEADLTTADGLDGTEKAQFILNHQNVQDAYDAIAKYTNDKRQAQGFTAFKLFPKADPETQGIINEYMALPQHDGSRGGNKARFLWAQSNPDKYAKIQNYFANVAEFDLANSAGEDKYQGATPSQKMLKSAYSLGKYDIYKDPKTGIYSINPSSAYQANQGSGSGSGFSLYVAKVKQGAQVRAAARELSRIRRMHPIRVRTNAQNRKGIDRTRLRVKRVKVARPKTGKLRIKSATIT